MIRLYSTFIFLFIYTGCVAQEPAWTGTTEVKTLAQNFSWFREGYDEYRPDSVYVNKLKKEFRAYTFLVFAGAWCGDTKYLLPKFYKTIHLAGFPEKNTELYLLDKRKKSPARLEKKYKIESIPTFILLKDGIEIGRIVEKTEASIEGDLWKLLNE